LQTHGPFALLLIRAGEPLLHIEHLAIVRIIFDDQDKECSEDEGETASAEEGYEVPESRRDVGGRGEVVWIIVDGSKSEQVGPLSRIFLSTGEWGDARIVECAVA